MARAQGARAQMTLAFETTYGTPPVGGFTKMPFASTSLGAEQPLVLILGADAFAGLTSWHRWRELFAFAHVAIANRPGHAPHERRWPAALDPALDEACTPRLTRDAAALAAAPAGCVMPFEMTPLAISATRIRALLAGAHSARYLLPDEVLDYIGKHSLYR